MNIFKSFFFYLLLVFVGSIVFSQEDFNSGQSGVQSVAVVPLEGTSLLTMEGDIASHLVDGVDRFLLGEIEKSIERRDKYWNRDFSSAEAYDKSIESNRRRLAHIIGVRDKRVPFDEIELTGTTSQPALIGRGDGYEIYTVRWPAFGDVHGEGLMLVPEKGRKVADVVAIPDADQTPEMIAGLVDGVPVESQFARRLVESGCRVIVPVLINRKIFPNQKRNRWGGSEYIQFSNREYLYRSAYELGRHLIGYEVQKVLALVDWFEKDAGGNSEIGVIGWGEGGLPALYSGALDTRIDAIAVSGYFDSRQNVWQETVCRNVFGFLEQFGDAELASMITPRTLIIEAAKGPEVIFPPLRGGAPGRLETPELENVIKEVARARQLVTGFKTEPEIKLVISDKGTGQYGTAETLQSLLKALSPDAKLSPSGQYPRYHYRNYDMNARHRRQLHEIDRHTQWLLLESQYVRKEFMEKLDTKSFIPRDLMKGEKRPVVVCQHGLEGRPQDVVSGDNRAYHDFAAKLAERGFITFAPQNLYIFNDRFRTLQRKGNPIKKTLYSIIVPQHQQIVNWLSSLPYVDPERIAFYGLSYGGKTAMRVPPLIKNYCLSICSGDFNEWVSKNASNRSSYSYLMNGEYEIFEFDLGSTFNYAEMAALIAPRPFMVERGHFDGVASDEMVAYEFAKVRHLYQAQLNIGNLCEIEWFVGPHTINGKGTFEFLHKHLKWHKYENK